MDDDEHELNEFKDDDKDNEDNNNDYDNNDYDNNDDDNNNDYDDDYHIQDKDDDGTNDVAGADIDEQSPSEADEESYQALHAPIPDNQIDVLDDHRARNCAHHPPQEEQLTEVARQQGALGRLICDIEEDPFEESNEQVTEEAEHDENGEDDDNTGRKRAPRNSCHNGIRSPITLAYYHGPWKMVLASSKVHWRRLLAIGNAWPLRENDLHFVKAILTERLLHFKNEGVVFDDEFQVNCHMWILIFQESSTFRGKLKDYVRPILPRFYKEVTPDEYEGNQLAVFDVVINRVKAILDDGSFHHRLEKDRLGKMNNFTHPCIGHVIQQFFYGKTDGLACSFPDDFSQEVPLNVISLVATAIVACLEEYLATGKQVNLPFDFKGYSGTYKNLLTAIDNVNKDEYHGQKLLNLRHSWAAGGMALLKPAVKPNGRVIPVNLD